MYFSIGRNDEGSTLTGQRRPRAYHTRDLQPKWSDGHVGVLLASVVHADAVAVRDELRCEVTREFQFLVP